MNHRQACPAWRGRATLLAFALLLSGCAARAPVDQIKYFSQAFNAVNTVGQPLLDDLALAERTQGRQIAERRARGKTKSGPEECQQGTVPWQDALDLKSGIINGFCIPDAPYFSDLGDPPATAMLRGGLSVVERYADVLSTLAENRNLDDALGQIDSLGQEVDGLLALASVNPVVNTALAALKPVLEIAARQANAAEARRLVLAGAPVVTQLIGALRQSTPAVFNTLIEESAAKLARPDPGGVVAAEVGRVNNYRLVMSQYVVLLNRLQKAWDETVAAAQAPNSGQGRLASLVAATAELRRDADAVRRSFSAVRAGMVPVR